jgi:hypothetical protein
MAWHCMFDLRFKLCASVWSTLHLHGCIASFLSAAAGAAHAVGHSDRAGDVRGEFCLSKVGPSVGGTVMEGGALWDCSLFVKHTGWL